LLSKLSLVIFKILIAETTICLTCWLDKEGAEEAGGLRSWTNV